MFRPRPSLVAIALLVAFVLAACAGAPTPEPEPEPDPEPFTIGGTILDLTGVPLPVNVTFMAALPEALGPAALAPAAVNAFPNGTVELASTVLSGDGAFELELPDGDEIPGAYLVDATVFLVDPSTDVTCTATSDDEARILRVYFGEGYAVPYTLLGPHNDLALALGLLLLGDGTPLSAAGDLATYTWTYAQGPVATAGSCTYDNGVDPAVVVATWDLDLVEGWNRLRFSYVDATGVTTVDTGTIDGARWRALVLAP